MAAQVSIIIPVLADSDAAGRLLPQLVSSPVEILLVNAGDDDGLLALAARHPGVRVLKSPPGRGRQMNAGAAVASGEWLLFLHADSVLPPGWYKTFDPDLDAVGGWFRFALDDRAWQARIIECLVAWRVRLLRLPYGDQGLFVRKRIFDKLGGFRDWPIMEDVDFAGRLQKTGSIVEVPLPLRTSSRRWRRDGWFRRSAKNTLLVLLYFAGVSPARLSRFYRPYSPSMPSKSSRKHL